jgi:hypothetical protein
VLLLNKVFPARRQLFENLDKVIKEQSGLAKFFIMVGGRFLSCFFVAMSLMLSFLPDIGLIALSMVLIGKNSSFM